MELTLHLIEYVKKASGVPQRFITKDGETRALITGLDEHDTHGLVRLCYFPTPLKPTEEFLFLSSTPNASTINHYVLGFFSSPGTSQYVMCQPPVRLEEGDILSMPPPFKDICDGLDQATMTPFAPYSPTPSPSPKPPNAGPS